MSPARRLGAGAILGLAAIASFAGEAAGKGGRSMPMPRHADPGAVIAAEAGYQRLAGEKGQKAAALETAAPFARILAPQSALVTEWAKTQTPAPAQHWQPHALWSSCDGTYAVTEGRWQTDAAQGRYVFVWQRQEDGSYKWLLRLEHALATPPADPDMISARVAECPPPTDRRDGPPPPHAGHHGKPPERKADRPPTDPLNGKSDDGTLLWQVRSGADGQPRFSLSLKSSGQLRDVPVD